MADPQYYIRQGVRRSVAAREAGFRTIPAKLIVAGRPDAFLNVPLDALHANRSTTPELDARYLRALYGFRDPAQRPGIPPILVTPLTDAPTRALTPLPAVRLIP